MPFLFRLTITGEPSHVGPTTMDRRRDSLWPRRRIIRRWAHRARRRAGWTRFRDLDRHPECTRQCRGLSAIRLRRASRRAERAVAMEAGLRRLDEINRRGVAVTFDPYATRPDHL
jgi:hypothetical protein